MNIKAASVSIVGLVSSRTPLWATISYLRDQCYYFLETMLLGCLEVCLSVRQQFYFKHTVGKMSSSGKMIYPKRCNGCGGPTAWPPQLHNWIQGIFSCGDTWRSTLHSPSNDYQRSCVMTFGSCDNGWCQCNVVCSRECFAAQCCLAWMNGSHCIY
jgi:hypothetical protein